jgi:hypothetical protein
MKLEKCFCGWTGPRGTMSKGGTPCCPICNRNFSNFKCEGCGE